MRERGSALLTAVVAVMVLLLISGILFSFVKNQFTMQTGEEKALKAYYLADAGTSFGIALSSVSVNYVINVKNGHINTGSNLLLTPRLVNNPFGAAYGGDFEVTDLIVSKTYPHSDGVRTVYIITATCHGYYPSKEDQHHIKRTIKKDYAFFITPAP